MRFVIDNLSTYWYQLAEIGRGGVRGPELDRSTSDLFEWCALGALRLHFTAFTGDVTSKRGAGEYGIVVTPDYMHDVLRAALDVRATGEGDVTTAMMLGAADVISWTVNEVRRAAV